MVISSLYFHQSDMISVPFLLCVFLHTALSFTVRLMFMSERSSSRSSMGRAGKAAKLGAPQWSGGTFDALGKTNQNNPMHRASKVNVDLAFGLQVFSSHMKEPTSTELLLKRSLTK